MGIEAREPISGVCSEPRGPVSALLHFHSRMAAAQMTAVIRVDWACHTRTVGSVISLITNDWLCSWHCVRAAGQDRCVDFCIAMERTAASFGCAGPRGCTFLHTPLTVHRCMRGVR